MDQCDLAAVNRWVGVVVAVIGACITAPAGVARVWHSTVLEVRRVGGSVRSTLARFLPFLRRTHQVTITDRIGVSSDLSVSSLLAGSGYQWSPDASVEVRLEQLRQRLDGVEGRLSDLHRQLRQEVSDRSAAMAQVEQSLNAEAATLRVQLARQEQQAAEVDSHGLPVLVVGIFLSGVPEDLAKLPCFLGWLVPFGGAAFAAVRGVEAWQRARASSTA